MKKRNSDIEKIGNALIYMSKNLNHFNKTIALKLLYILDKWSIEESGIPYFGLDYEVWRLGPVNREIYIDFNEPNLLTDYIKIEMFSGNITKIIPIAEFNDDEFSDNELFMLNYIIKECNDNNLTAKDLVNYLNSKESLWDKTAERNNLKELFENNRLNSTEIKLDFKELIKNNPFKLSRYIEYLENKDFNNFLKGIA